MKNTQSDSRPAANRKGLSWGILITLLALTGLSSAVSAAAPDLIVDRPRLSRTLLIEKRTFTANDCAVIEGCITGTGTRRLLRFAIGFINLGPGHLRLGNPADRPDLYEYSPCHGHFHMKGTAKYVLYNPNGGAVLVGRKQAFCLLDTVKYLKSAGPSKGFTCENQGLTAGWADVYYRNLDCQWLDITNVPRGNYTLKVTVNPGRIFGESNYSNNSASIPVFIP